MVFNFHNFNFSVSEMLSMVDESKETKKLSVKNYIYQIQVYGTLNYESKKHQNFEFDCKYSANKFLTIEYLQSN